MISDARRGHVSPGIYTEEKDVVFSVKSLGITSLGLVGETLYGPAFQNVEISSWGEFVDYFGGTSAEKFKNGNPKYELPYVAKSYLEESKQLNVVRVLGLSGYEAGPAFVIHHNGQPVVVLRSKMTYNGGDDLCNSASTEQAKAIVSGVALCEYTQTLFNTDCSGNRNSGVTEDIINKFGIKVTCKLGYGFSENLTYNVSLNPSDSDYIYNVIDSTPEKGTTPIYIEAVYENSLPNEGVTKSQLGVESAETKSVAVKTYYKAVKSISADTYEVIETIPSDGAISVSGTISGNVLTISGDSKVEENQVVVITKEDEGKLSFEDFKEGYRPAVTPWIVSEAIVSGDTDATAAYVKKLFRFITISDGDASNFQVKVSIQNIDVEDGTFDVVVRDFYDSDANPLILESFRKCNLVFGDANCVAAKIGTSDGGFVSKSKYILVEMAEGEDFGKSFPAGFLGYPMPSYVSSTSSAFNISYNTVYRPEIKAKRQYFGLSDLAGIDSDIFKYKGREFYSGAADHMTKGFHMEAAINSETTVYVDNYEGYRFDGVHPYDGLGHTKMPRLINVKYINETLYEDIKTRKFTVCFCGGFDGWDVNREERTNTDKYKSTKYGRKEDNFYGPYVENDLNLHLDLPTTAITSDYYAYLAGCRVFSNPQDIDINIFATPGINWGDNAMLTEEVIDMIEDADEGRGGDALYVMASPGPNKVTTPQEAVNAFEDAEINSSYVCTYFPWVMYYDASNKRYLNLPVTKDVVKNMAAVDNNSYPWFAPAGTERGKVNCVKAAYKTRLSDEDALYEASINPVKSFAQDGVIIWGNKTAYPVETPTNRINVRRMMIRLKKLIVNAAKNLIFEQYDEELEKQFRGIVEPILADVKANRGIIDYRVITECTPETRDQHILPAKILVKPVQALEYISISFVVYPESVKFDE